MPIPKLPLTRFWRVSRNNCQTDLSMFGPTPKNSAQRSRGMRSLQSMPVSSRRCCKQHFDVAREAVFRPESRARRWASQRVCVATNTLGDWFMHAGWLDIIRYARYVGGFVFGEASARLFERFQRMPEWE